MGILLNMLEIHSWELAAIKADGLRSSSVRIQPSLPSFAHHHKLVGLRMRLNKPGG